MADMHPDRLAAALELLRNTTQNAHSLCMNRHEAERQYEADIHRLKRFGGKLAVDHYMHGKTPDVDTVGEGAKLLVIAGLRLGWAAMLRAGVEAHLKNDLRQTDAAIAESLNGLRIEARPNDGVSAREVIGLHEPTGIRRYDIPESGVEGAFVGVDAEWGRIYLQSSTPGGRWVIEPFDKQDNFNQRVTFSTIPPTA